MAAQQTSSTRGYGRQAGVGGPARNGLGTAALVLGIVSLVAWLLPLVGLPVAVVGIVLGFLARGRVARGEATNGGAARWGLVLSVIGLVLTLGNAVLGAMAATGS